MPIANREASTARGAMTYVDGAALLRGGFWLRSA